MARLVGIMLLATVIAGCAADRSLTLLSEREIHQALGSADVIATESGFDELSGWLSRSHQTRMELGPWLPGEAPTLLVTIDVIDTSHAGRLAHHILAVFDPITHRRLTPAFHYIADHVHQRRIMPGGDRQCIVYVGVKENGPWVCDVSYVLAFAPDRIDADRVLGDRDPVKYAVLAESHLNLLRVARRDGPHVTPIARLVWAPEQRQFHTQPIARMALPAID